jgi:uncharacterized protein
MKKHIKILSFLLIVSLLAGSLYAADFPERPKPPRLVNDLTGFLAPDESSRLESKLEQFSRETSTQIAIAIVPDLHGYAPSDYAIRLAEKWGVGQKGKDNGILILVKPKTPQSKGEVFIATGYGVEGAVPDAIAKRIVEVEIIPEFKKGNYFAGLDKATTRIMELTRGEYTAEQYIQRTKKKDESGIFGLIIPLLLFFLFFVGGSSRRRRHATMGRNVPFWTLFFLGGAGRSGGSFNDFSSGSGSFGGFGGFGGGSFGGGGAGGSW